MIERRSFLALFAATIGALVATITGRMTMRPWVVGDSSIANVGASIGDGVEARITDSATGAGLFNPNTDPAVVGIDPLTGAVAPTGTDMSFGAATRRQMQTNVINGDFAVLPPLGADSVIVSDPNDAGYNPLPGWTWTPSSDGTQSAFVTADATLASGYKFVTSGNPGSGELSQFVAVPMSRGQQYRVLVSAFGLLAGAGSSVALVARYYKADATTAVGAEMTRPVASGGLEEAKIDAGIVPTTAAYILVTLRCTTTSSVRQEFGEVRCAFLPAEAEVGLRSITSNVGAFSTSETQVVGATIPANSWTVGSTYRIRAFGQVVANSSAAHTVTLRCRIGTSSLSGNIAASRAPATSGTASGDPFSVEALVTCRSVGASGTVIGGVAIIGNATQPFNAAQFIGNSGSTVVVDTTAANVIELTGVTSNAGTTVAFHLATIECVMAS